MTREVEHYNLDMILALGFRMRSLVGVRFRRWATDKLKGYIVKGFVMDDARLKHLGKRFTTWQYLVFAEGQAMRRVAMTMREWMAKLEGFLMLNDREILQGAGFVSAQLAKTQAEQELDKFRMVKCLPSKPPGRAR
ncbi:MAG: Conserved virulence protein [Comamonadaceae bacterium]|nr:MAG: Conserved virulence protein [Comamonadaceae bacterium]